jgi:cytoskeletal protein RodZ
MTEPTIGTLLRQKREKKKLTLDQVFQAIKIRVNYLQAIENDQLDLLPSRAQARGFIRLYANYLGLNAYELLDHPEPEPAPVSEPAQSAEPVTTATAEPSTAPEATEISLMEKLDEMMQDGRKSLQGALGSSSEKVKDTWQRLVDKLPFVITMKKQTPPAVIDEPPATEGKTKTPAARPGSTYLAMSRSIGDDLRKAREALGLSLADVERQIRIREAYLQAMEDGSLDELPSTVQGRGMLGNYATFLNLDSAAYQSRFAEVLQQRRVETMQEEKEGVPIPERSDKPRLTGMKRIFSPDMIFAGGLFLAFFIFIIWGVFQLLQVGGDKNQPTVAAISDVLLASESPTMGEMVVVETAAPTSMIGNDTIFTPEASAVGTQTFSANDPVQLSIAVNRRVFMKVTIDGKSVFLGRALPGNIYTYSGKSRISLVAGDASAIQIFYNQTNMGVPGISGQVVMMDFTASKAIDLTANYTPTPTVTSIATLTPLPTDTPTATVPVTPATP